MQRLLLHRLAIASLVFSMAGCSSGSTDKVALVALLSNGLADGQQLMMYGLGIGKVRRLDASHFEFDIGRAKIN
jgi:hypothetical protein